MREESSPVEPTGVDAAASAPPTEGNWRAQTPISLPPILAAALAEIVEHGYDATSVRTIAKRVGVTVPALYYHYENKQAILAALLHDAMDVATAYLDAALGEVGDDPVDRFSFIVEALCLFMVHHPDLAFLDSERRSLTPENRERYLAQRDHIDEVIGSAIEAGCATGVFRTPIPHTVRRAILSMCQGISVWYRPGGPKSPAEIAADHIRIALAAVEYVEPSR